MQVVVKIVVDVDANAYRREYAEDYRANEIRDMVKADIVEGAIHNFRHFANPNGWVRSITGD